MSIDNATPADWDRLRKQHPAIDEPVMKVYMEMTQEELDAAHDNINQPEHYNTGNIECIEAIEESMTPEAFQGYLKGNCMKYLWRYKYKGKPLEDLQKAQWYLSKLIQEEVFRGTGNG